MAVVMNCPICGHMVRANSEDELLEKANQHVKEVHNIPELPKDMMEQATLSIREETPR